MKKIFALILIAATLLLLCSCGMTADKLELRLEAMEENGDVFYVAMDKDELADEEEEILSEDDGSFLADGSATIAEINDALGTELDENDEDYTTVGGLIIKLLGYLPEENELPYLEFGGCAFSVEEISERRIEKVRISKLTVDETESEAE